MPIDGTMARRDAANNVDTPNRLRAVWDCGGWVCGFAGVVRTPLRRTAPVVCSVALLLSGMLAVERRTLGQEPSGLAAVAAIESALVDAIAQAEKSVVAIARVRRNDREETVGLELRADPFGRLAASSPQPKAGDPDFIPNEYGTGVIVDRDGLIVTHYHVLGEDSELYVTTAARKVYRARIKAADPRSDLAVLSVDAHDLVPIKLGDAAGLRKGQIVVALGNPYAIARDGQVSASWGIVANLARKGGPTVSDEGGPNKKTMLHQFGTLIQTDAKLNLGTSGGALINLKGEMIGLITAAAALSGYEQAAGYAVPVDDTFRRVLEKLKQGREVEYGFLGISPKNLDENDILAGRRGMRVDQVHLGTPAHRHGLQPGDVISHVNGKPIFDADGLMLHVGKLPVESVVKLTVERGGRVLPVSLELSKFPVQGKKVVTNPAPAWRGIRVDYATVKFNARPSNFINDIDSDGKVLVLDVEQPSPAWSEGLRPDMYVTHVGGTRVTNPKEFRAAVAGKTGPVALRVVTGAGDVKQIIKTIPAEE